jgi:hypothetical protein
LEEEGPAPSSLRPAFSSSCMPLWIAS